MIKLSKEQSRKRFAELRTLWNKFDPIGVHGDELNENCIDEYDTYVGQSLRYLEKSQFIQLYFYIKSVCRNHMELNIPSWAILKFTYHCQKWFWTNWRNSYI